MPLTLLGVALLVGTLTGVASLAQDDARQKALQAVFDDLEKGIKATDEAPFKARWHAEGYEKNLCGGSGLAGKAVFGQGSRKKWFLKPDLAKAEFVGDGAAAVVFCEVYAWEKGKAVDKVSMVLVKDKDAWIVLGGGEKRPDVDGLVSRWTKKEPLEAPGKPE
jgi:hypothetical protein